MPRYNSLFLCYTQSYQILFFFVTLQMGRSILALGGRNRFLHQLTEQEAIVNIGMPRVDSMN